MHLINFNNLKPTTKIPDSFPTSSYQNNITEVESTTISPQFNTTFSYETDNFDTQHDILFPDQLQFFHNKIIYYNQSTISPILNSTTAPTIESTLNTQVAFLASFPAIFFLLTVVILLLWFLHQKRREGIFCFDFSFINLHNYGFKLFFTI